MKETRIPPAHAANMVANSDNVKYGVWVTDQEDDYSNGRHGNMPYFVVPLFWFIKWAEPQNFANIIITILFLQYS